MAHARSAATPRPTSMLRDWATLCKARIQVMATASALACAWLAGGGSLELATAVHLFIGLTLVSSAASALNQVLEVEIDALMERTKNRPLPTGRISLRTARWFGGIAAGVGCLWLAVFLNPLTGWLAFVMLVLYDFVYTPLKRVTSLNTLVGALPGGMPLLVGWAAAGNGLNLTAGILFAILFLWQLPHFLSIAWMYREDYERGGLRMLPSEEAGAQLSARQAANYALALVPVSLFPTLTSAAGALYFYGALTLSLGFLVFVLRFSLAGGCHRRARALMRASLVYLPLLIALLLADTARAAVG